VTTSTDRNCPEDFASFMRAYQDMVFSTAARITANDAHAEDIAQEVFIKAFEHYEQLRTSATAGGWLKTVARNLSLNHVARYRRRWRFFSEMHRDEPSDQDTDLSFAAPDRALDEISTAERHELIEQALRSLPDRLRVPLVLFHFEAMPYEGIARQLDVSLAKVKMDIFRARAALAKALARRGIGIADAAG
jgi:RNA polymerase sigma-70 factor (ECF subfamily)